MKNTLTLVLFSTLLFGCKDATVRKYDTAPKEVAEAKKKLISAQNFTSSETEALKTITEFETPLIKARFSDPRVDGDGKLYCTYEYMFLKLIVRFSGGRFVDAHSDNRWDRDINNEEYLLKTKEEFDCKALLQVELAHVSE